jgi:hypothetical protein
MKRGAVVVTAIVLALPSCAPAVSPSTHIKGHIMDTSGQSTIILLTPPPVTLDLDNVPILDAAKAFSAASGVTIQMRDVVPEVQRQTVTLHLHRTPFLEALFQFREQTHSMSLGVSERNVTLGWSQPPNPSDNGAPLWCISGPFAVGLSGISHSVEIEGNKDERNQMRLVIDADPRILSSATLLTIEPLKDERGQEVKCDILPLTTENGESAVLCDLHLPSDPGRIVPLMQGNVSMLVAQSTSVSWKDDARRVLVHEKDYDVEIARVMYDKYGTEFQVTVVRTDCPYDRWQRILPFLLKLQASAHGTDDELLPCTVSRANRSADTLVTSIRISGPASVKDFHVGVPLDAQQVRFPFEFRNVILP